MNPSPLISLREATIAVGPKVLFQDLTWQLYPSEHWVISGNCVVGKTVLAEFLAYKHRLVSGSRTYALVPGLDLTAQLAQGLRMISFTDTSDLFLNHRGVHYYQQRFNAFDAEGHLTMREYLEAEGKPVSQGDTFLRDMGIAHLLDTERIKLSSGQTRKMLLAKALISQPKVLILDNAYIGLDTESRKVLNDSLDQLVATQGISLILAGHPQELPACITHRLHIHPDRKVEILPGSAPLPPTPPPAPRSHLLEQIRSYFAEKLPPPSFTEVIRMEALSIQYGDKKILGELNWLVLPGEKWAVYGPNGSGKSTLLSLIYADNPQAYAKPLSLFGKKRGSGESIWELKARMGFTSPELHSFFRDNPTAETLVLTGLTDTFQLRRNPTSAEKHLLNLLFAYFDLTEARTTPFRQLSTGTQRLLLFLRALIKVPPVLLLDEPFQGMDSSLVASCKTLLDGVLQKKQTLIFISHYPKEWPRCVEQVLALV